MNLYQKNGLDQFFTSNEDAKRCIESLDLRVYSLIVEPSAGRGAFSSQIPNCVSFDLSPQSSGIIQRDWLSVQKEEFQKHSHILVIGNPPFGTRGSLAKTFIKHSIEIGAEGIGFILPKTFQKFSNQKCFPKEWRLVDIIGISGNFTLANGEARYIPCDFFYWTRRLDICPNRNLRSKPEERVPEEFIFLRRNDKSADFSINGNNGKVKEISQITNPKAEHYIRVVDRNKVGEVKEKMSRLQYFWVSSVSGGVSWINRDDIIGAWFDSSTV